MLIDLSKRINSKQELRVLATKGLEMEDYELEAVSQNKDLLTASNKLLKSWNKEIPDRKIAYSKLCKALKSVNMAFYVENVLEKD